ncbi:nuclear transport factor 2 family protein [Maritimibacter sp. DP1N21-5]|uniref:nuclear transport factor 2 family protein n=1 Tax=Maritimibacter sp. DP1N21-5 TaxID=2836867 RepID=UPI001C477AF0|nr:nuclear transport factor 2 family protein [Maritimibacter sp. DP1N21-5]MBV7407454.1 nuclear transport factor 2 family protein [Maritimibacter sp. DP1N21-5]
MSTREDAIRLIQSIYYDSIDAGDMARAATALHPDIDWSHAQVWAHHDFARAEPSGFKGRQAVRDFLAARVDQLREARITHGIEDMVFENDRGAFLGNVTGPDGTTKPFMVWFALTDGLVSRYDLRPL